MFDHLGKLVSRRWAWVLVAWIVLVAALKLTAPDWASISQDDDIKSFPPHFDSVVGHDLLEKAFPDDVFNSQIVVIVEKRAEALSDLDLQFVDTLAQRLTDRQRGGELLDANGNKIEDTFGLHEFITYKSEDKGKLLTSEDKHATLLYAGCDHTFLAKKVEGTVNALRKEVAVMRKNGEVPDGIEVAVTGSAGVGADLQTASDESLARSFRTTIVLVILILLFVYRSPIVAFIPLVTIAVSVLTSMSLMSLMTLVQWGNFHFQVLKITNIFVIVVLFGAGTDYCLFLIARYREELEHGHDRESALRLAIHHVGGALAASAATVVVGLGMMIFADFGKFRCTGPAVAVSLAVALVGALTLTPALLRLLGPIVFWPFKIHVVAGPTAEPGGHGEESRFTRRFWDSLSGWITRRPVAIWATSVLVMLPFAIWGYRLVPTYDFLSELSDSAESKIGARLIEQDGHFPRGSFGTLTLMLRTPEGGADLREPTARKDIAELTRRIVKGGSEEGEQYAPEQIAKVRSATSPLGEPLPDEPEPPAPVPEPEKPAARPGLNPFKAFGNAAKAVQNPWLDGLRQKGTAHYVSSTAGGHVMRLDVVFNVAPFSKESMHLRDGIDRIVREITSQPGTTLTDAKHAFAGITSSTYDLAKITQSDQKRINFMVVFAVYIILVLLLRQPGVCIYLMVTVLFSYWATLGMTEGVFRLLHEWRHPGLPWLGLDWKVAFFLFIILVAVGEDYNILLMSRVVEEERRRGPFEGVRHAVARTGGIITSCGIIMAGTFGSMATGTLAAIIQLGFALALGVLLDTFIVRPVLVPAFLLMLHSAKQGIRRSPPSARPQSDDRPRFADQPQVQPIGVAAAPASERPHFAEQPQDQSVAAQPVSTAHRRGLIALLLAWFGRSL